MDNNTVVEEQSKKPATLAPAVKFPFENDLPRLNAYGYHKRLFRGDHFSAFRIQINDPEYNKEYARLRYVTANFPGLISKVVSDLLFIEHPKIQVKDGDQAFIDALRSENAMRVSCYEHALTNSYYGDALFKIRIGQRHPNNPDPTVIIEQVTPRIYFPKYDGNNVTGDPIEQALCWVTKIGENAYLRKEIHTPGNIRNEVYELEGDPQGGYVIKQKQDLSILGIADLTDEQETGIDRSLVIHIPNWRGGESAFGTSDYYDLDSLFFGINNRLSKVDNILDKHGDPILTVPPGVIDEDGKVKKKHLGVIEMGDDEQGKPEYIVWDAKLDSAFSEIDRLIDITCMISETSPVIAGIDKGGAIDSGRALKFKMLRTLAKAQRKQLYYTDGLTEVYYVAQLMAKAHKIKVDGIALTKDPVKPEIIWQDGLPADRTEDIANEGARLDQGTTTKIAAIMRLDDVDEDIAKAMAKEIDDEGKIALQSQMDAMGKQFGKGVDGGPPVKPGTPKPDAKQLPPPVK